MPPSHFVSLRRRSRRRREGRSSYLSRYLIARPTARPRPWPCGLSLPLSRHADHTAIIEARTLLDSIGDLAIDGGRICRRQVSRWFASISYSVFRPDP